MPKLRRMRLSSIGYEQLAAMMFLVPFTQIIEVQHQTQAIAHADIPRLEAEERLFLGRESVVW